LSVEGAASLPLNCLQPQNWEPTGKKKKPNPWSTDTKTTLREGSPCRYRTVPAIFSPQHHMCYTSNFSYDNPYCPRDHTLGSSALPHPKNIEGKHPCTARKLCSSLSHMSPLVGTQRPGTSQMAHNCYNCHHPSHQVPSTSNTRAALLCPWTHMTAPCPHIQISLLNFTVAPPTLTAKPLATTAPAA